MRKTLLMAVGLLLGAVGANAAVVHVDDDDRANWTFTVSSYRTDEGGATFESNNITTSTLYDDDTSTFWLSQWSGVKLPAAIVVDMKESKTFGGIGYKVRANRNDAMTEYRIYVSDSELSATPIENTSDAAYMVAGGFVNQPASADTEVQILFDEMVSGRYLKIVAYTSTSNNNLAVAFSELSILGEASAGDTYLVPTSCEERTNWVITGCSTHRNEGEGKDSSYAQMMDGNSNTYWHSEYGQVNNGHPNETPHYFVVNRGTDNGPELYGFTFLPRQHTSGNGYVTDYRVYVLDNVDGLNTAGSSESDNSAFTTDNHESLTTFLTNKTAVKTGSLDIVYNDVSTHGEKVVAFDAPVNGQYVLFVIDGTSSSDGANLFANCAEFNLLTSAPEEKTGISPARREQFKNKVNAHLYANVWSDATKSEIDARIDAVSTQLDLYKVLMYYTDNGLDQQIFTIRNIRRTNQSKGGYLTVNPENNQAYGSSTVNAYSRWQLKKASGSGTSAYYKLYNIESKSYLSASNNSVVTTNANDACAVTLAKNTASNPNGVSLQFINSDNGLFFSDTETDLVTANAASQAGASWKLSDQTVPVSQLSVNKWYRIRSNRGIYNNGLPGSYVGVHSADISKDKGANYIYATKDDFSTMWTLVAGEGGTWKLKNLITEDKMLVAPASNNIGGKKHMLMDETGTGFYLKDVALWNNPCLTFHGVAIATTNEANNQNNCSDVCNAQSEGEYHIYANEWKPSMEGNRTEDYGSVFYFELAEEYEVEAARQAYIAYANEHNATAVLGAKADATKSLMTQLPALFNGADASLFDAAHDAEIVTATDIASANVVLTTEVDENCLNAYQSALTAANAVAAGKYFSLRNVANPTHIMNVRIDSSSNQYAGSEEVTADATINAVGHVWRLVSAGSDTYKLYSYGVDKFIGVQDTNGRPISMADEASAADFSLVYGPLWETKNTISFQMPVSNENNLLWDDYADDAHRITIWSPIKDNIPNAQWSVELIDFEPRASIKIGGKKDVDKGWQLTFTGAGLVKTEGLGAHHSLVYGNTPAKEEGQSEENGAVAYAMDGEQTVAPDASNITVDGGVATLTLIDAEDGNYTINVPAGFFTVNNKLSEPFSADVTLKNGVVTSISEVMPAVDVEAEYFDLNGRKVLNPAGGIFIVRKGDKVIKQIIR